MFYELMNHFLALFPGSVQLFMITLPGSMRTEGGGRADSIRVYLPGGG